MKKILYLLSLGIILNVNLFGRAGDRLIVTNVQNNMVPTVVSPPDIVISCCFMFDINTLTDPNDATFGRVVTDLTLRKKVVTQDMVCYRYCLRDDYTGYPGYVPTNAVPKPAPNQACDYYRDRFDTAHWDNKHELAWGFDGYVLGAPDVVMTITVNDLRECGQGIIQRVINAKEGNNINVSAVQTIWVVNCDPFKVDTTRCNDTLYSDIVWPKGVCNKTAVIVQNCETDLSPDNPALGRPRGIISQMGNCTLLSIDFQDNYVASGQGNCLEVQRKWVVIDWCQYDPFISPLHGRWEQTQKIQVSDTSAPTLNIDIKDQRVTDPLGLSFININLNPKDNCLPSEFVSMEYKIDEFNDGVGTYAGGFNYRVGPLNRKDFDAGVVPNFADNPRALNSKNPFDASGSYPVGIHKIECTVTDVCGNVSTFTQIFEIKLILSLDPSNSASYELKIVPNPAKDHISIQISTEIDEIRIVSSYGKTLYSKKVTGNQQVDLDQMPSGVYFVQAYLRNQLIAGKKLVVVE